MASSLRLFLVACALTLSTTAVGYGSFKLLEQSLVDESEALVHSVAQSLLPALLINDTEQVNSLLKSLQNYSIVQSADLINSAGAPIASFSRDGYLADPSQAQFELASAEELEGSGRLHVMAPITIDTQILANLHLSVNLWPAYMRIVKWIGLILLLAATIYAFVDRFHFKIRFEKNYRKSLLTGRDQDFSLDQLFKSALQQADIRLEYQPIKRISDGGVFGMEVIVCWSHPSGQSLHLSPADFLRLAEQEELFLPFGQWVMETACRQAAAWQVQHGPLVLAINIALSQLKDANFSSQLREICEITKFPHQLMEFEVNEAELLSSSDYGISDIQAFGAQGFSLTIDSFGLSPHSASLLQSNFVNKIKIDKNFVKSIDHDEDINAHIATLCDQALGHDKQIMADGVSTQAQRDKLQMYGCILAQGALTGQPLSVDQFSEMLSDQQSKSGRSAVQSVEHLHNPSFTY